jgi:hypothetical protein
MIVRIEHLRMSLPAGYEHQASEISRHVGELLARTDARLLRSASSLNLPPISIHNNSSPREIAHAIVSGITATLGDHR